MADVWTDRNQRALERYGWLESNAHACPLFVLNRRHRDEGCICHAYGDLLDHAAVWYDPNKRRIYTFEPYSADSRDLSAFLLDLEMLGLHAAITGQGLWHEMTFLAIVRET